MNIYIEVFLLDNFVMDMLIIRLAGAICGMAYSGKSACAVCAAMAVFSAFAVGNAWLCSLPVKVCLCIICAVPFHIKQKRFSVWATLAVFFATMLTGGIACSFAFSGGRAVIANKWVRVVLYPAFITAFLPTVLRNLRKKRIESSMQLNLIVIHGGKKFNFCALMDSGNMLTEPLSGKPIIPVYAPQLMQFANIPVPYADTGNESSLMYAFFPDSVCVNGTFVEAAIAPLSANPAMKALIPQSVVMCIDKFV